MKKTSKFFSLLTSAALVLFLVSGSVAVPILCRGFYYSQAEALALDRETGFSQEVIREAFDEMMDYLVKDEPFGTGTLKWSESGQSHFADCKALFQLDFRVLEAAAALLVAVAVLSLSGKLRLHRFAGRGPCFWAFVGMGTVVLLLGIWAVVDFTSLFTAFHTLFFPGKSNWIFDPRMDEIILILPEAFWLRAAALVAGLAFGAGALLTVLEEILHRVRKPKSVYEELRDMR